MQSTHAALNAALNLTCAFLLVAGWRAIRAGDRERHRRRMLAALGVSIVFLVSYGIRFALKGGTTTFPEDAGAVRLVYLGVLISHSILAAVVPPLAVATVVLAFRERWSSHKRLARITFPLWLYVSATGVVVYLMLYHLAPALQPQ